MAHEVLPRLICSGKNGHTQKKFEVWKIGSDSYERRESGRTLEDKDVELPDVPKPDGKDATPEDKNASEG